VLKYAFKSTYSVLLCDKYYVLQIWKIWIGSTVKIVIFHIQHFLIISHRYFLFFFITFLYVFIPCSIFTFIFADDTFNVYVYIIYSLFQVRVPTLSSSRYIVITKSSIVNFICFHSELVKYYFGNVKHLSEYSRFIIIYLFIYIL